MTGEFSQAIRKNTDITLGLYHSLYEWFHPFYVKDVANNFTTQDYVKVIIIILSVWYMLINFLCAEQTFLTVFFDVISEAQVISEAH